MFGRLTITQKGLVLITIPLLCQLALAAAFIRGQAYRSDVEDWAIHTKRVIAQAETFFRVLVEADSEVNAFVVSGRERADVSFNQLVDRAPIELSSVRKLVSDNPQQVARLDDIAVETNRLAGQMRELYRLGQAKDSAATAAKMQQIIQENAVSEIRRRIDVFIDTEDRLDRKRLGALSKVQVAMRLLSTLGTTLMVAVSFLCAWLFGRTIVSRLKVLNENVRRFIAGETLAARVGGGDELAALDDSFHSMATGLSEAAAKEKESQANLTRHAAELTAMNRELTQKSEENEMFVYSVSHDLRSPLVNLQGFSKELSLAMKEMRAVFGADDVPVAMRAQGEDILVHGMAEPVMFIQTAVTRLSAIIDALLRLSRAGRVEYQRTEVDTGAVVRRVIDATRSVIDQKKAQVSVVSELPRVWGDPTAVEQIFANIIGNALNYLDKNRPGIIEVGSRPYESDPSLAVCYVKDTGLGIPEAYLGKVFGIFQRVHGNVAVGEGIGLALVRRMVERHGGRIWVESSVGVGSTFFVALPKVEQVEDAESGHPMAESERQNEEPAAVLV